MLGGKNYMVKIYSLEIAILGFYLLILDTKTAVHMCKTNIKFIYYIVNHVHQYYANLPLIMCSVTHAQHMPTFYFFLNLN